MTLSGKSSAERNPLARGMAGGEPPGSGGGVSLLSSSSHLSASIIAYPLGGSWTPPPALCAPRYRVAIIIPYRDRKEHLSLLLAHLHPLLQLQLLSYTIYVVEQVSSLTFLIGLENF